MAKVVYREVMHWSKPELRGACTEEITINWRLMKVGLGNTCRESQLPERRKYRKCRCAAKHKDITLPEGDLYDSKHPRECQQGSYVSYEERAIRT